jgi:hypothetical protein
MFARFASDAFSRAINCAPLGRSIEKIVKASPVERKVPEVSLVRSKDKLEQALKSRVLARSAGASTDWKPLCRRAVVMLEP